jgi:hypothetical protein
MPQYIDGLLLGFTNVAGWPVAQSLAKRLWDICIPADSDG